MIVDKNSLSYSHQIKGYEISSLKILAFTKLLFEDILQCCCQVAYLALKTDAEYIVISISLAFAACSILVSLYSLIYGSASTLNKQDFEMLKSKFGIV